MAKTESKMLNLGTEAPIFRLTNGIDESYFSRDQLMGPKGLLVFFICNHCPYVLHIIEKLTSIAHHYQSFGVGMVAISSNDIEQFPDDHPEKMNLFSSRFQFKFPYLFDQTQEVAKSFSAACTPDFFLFDHNKHLVYRGRFDGATPGNTTMVSGADLEAALQSLVLGLPISEAQLPSLGCNIKWSQDK